MQKFRRLLYPALALCFLLGMLGFFLGRRSVDGLVLSTKHPASAETQSRSLPADPSAVRETVGRIDLNSATLEELMTLPGIGEVRARGILAYRESNGPFRQAADLMNVSGIGEGIFAKLRDYVYVEVDHESTDY